VNKKRPINLDLSTMKFPVMAVTSILHRVSGLLLFLLLPLIIYFLQRSLQSAQSFAELQTLMMTNQYIKVLLWVFSAALIYHLFAGIRHLIMDIGFGEHLEAGRKSAMVVMVCSIFVMILLGFWIW
jgi:succinate dehydrogenase / fumarate reductase cytochrome b subunit